MFKFEFVAIHLENVIFSEVSEKVLFFFFFMREWKCFRLKLIENHWFYQFVEGVQDSQDTIDEA